MKQSERVAIAKEFNIAGTELSSLLSILAKTRNLCAHDERLYNYDYKTNTSINDTRYHSQMNLPITNNRYNIGKNDLFAVVIIMKYMLSEREFRNFINEIGYEVDYMEAKIQSVPFINILNKIGFPVNWRDIITLD